MWRAYIVMASIKSRKPEHKRPPALYGLWVRRAAGDGRGEGVDVDYYNIVIREQWAERFQIHCRRVIFYVKLTAYNDFVISPPHLKRKKKFNKKKNPRLTIVVRR